MKIKKRYHLKKKKLKEFQTKLGPYSSLIPSKSKVEILESDLPDLILVDGDPLIIILDGDPFPTLKGALKHPIESHMVVVDMGAVKFMASGADVMSPGVVDAGSVGLARVARSSLGCALDLPMLGRWKLAENIIAARPS